MAEAAHRLGPRRVWYHSPHGKLGDTHVEVKLELVVDAAPNA